MARRTFTPEQKAEALELFALHGKSEAARITGISAGTIGAWASRAGVATVAADVTRAATAVSAERRRFAAEEFRTRMVEQLATIAETAAAKELEVLRKDKPSLDKIVGARTRAIHDLQLLTGQSTANVNVERTPETEAEVAKVIALRSVA